MNLENLKGLLVELERDELFDIDGGWTTPMRFPPMPQPPGSWGGC